jgi:hypothetical protein
VRTAMKKSMIVLVHIVNFVGRKRNNAHALDVKDVKKKKMNVLVIIATSVQKKSLSVPASKIFLTRQLNGTKTEGYIPLRYTL